mgnify:CR=1 FL=1
MSVRPRCDRTLAWRALQGHYQAHGRTLDLREAFARDAGRVDAFSCQAPEVFADLSKNLWDLATHKLLIELAGECGLAERRDAMFAGEAINTTEGRAALHTALRAPRGSGAPFANEVHAVLDAMLAYAEQVRDTAASGIRDVVNIGIGGSDLGPQMVVPALHGVAHPQIRFHFVSNVDGHDITPVLQRLQPASTLFVIASKTFTTQETMANAAVARQWFVDQGGRDIARHFVGTTTNLAAAAEFGITTTFGFWDWVGGRYSMWSAIGLPIAIAVGAGHFRALLAGAHAMDRHFATEPFERNLPVLLGLLDVWYRNFHGFTSRSVAPYHQGLKRLPAYLQQLEMESNGKGIDREGRPVGYATAPVIFGAEGTNAQHAFMQLLHQGPQAAAADFIDASVNERLSANALAQADALAYGTADATLPSYRRHPGNRPSSILKFKAFRPRDLGRLIALYEHKVFTQGVLWNINSFDQWGVELGKQMAQNHLSRST